MPLSFPHWIIAIYPYEAVLKDYLEMISGSKYCSACSSGQSTVYSYYIAAARTVNQPE